MFHFSFLVPLDSTAQAGQVNGDDWQEETYQKVPAGSLFSFVFVAFYLRGEDTLGLARLTGSYTQKTIGWMLE